MKYVQRRHSREIVRGFFLLSHPIPVLFHMMAVTGLALFAAFPHFAWCVIALVVLAHLAMQLSIAFINDYCDRHLDATSKREKPIALGLVRPKEALIAGIALVVIMVLLLLPLPPLALLISCVYLALGQGYNLGLKSTPFSGIIFALAFPLIPLYAFAGIGHIPPVVVWLVPVAALLGCAINLANSTADIETDRANGAYTLAVVLGVKRVYWLCPLLILSSVLLIAGLAMTHLVQASPLLLWGTLVLVCVAFFVLLNMKDITRKHYFYVVVGTSLIIAAGWLLGVL